MRGQGMLVKVDTIWDESELKRLEEILSKTSVNYVEPEKPKPLYPMIDKFRSCANLALFKGHGLEPEKLPTESTIIIGSPLAGKSLLMYAWKEVLKVRVEKTTSMMDEYSRKFENDWLKEYNKDLSKNSSAWICERDTMKYFDNYDNDANGYKTINWKKYFFLDDLFFRNPYPFHSEKKTDQNFISFQEDLFRFLEINKDIIVIASSNNYAYEALAKDANGTIMDRYKAIFKREITL